MGTLPIRRLHHVKHIPKANAEITCEEISVTVPNSQSNALFSLASFLGLLLYSEWLYSVWARRLEEWPGSAGVMLTGWRAGSLEIAPFGAGSWDSFELSLSWNHTVVWFGRDQFLHSEKGQLQLGQSAQSPVQPDLGCLQGWGIQYPSWRPVLFTIKNLFSYIHLSILSVHQKISNTHIFLL